MKRRGIRRAGISSCGVPAVFVLLAILLSGCGGQQAHTIVCGGEALSAYAAVLSRAAPDYFVRLKSSPDLSAAGRGASVAALDMQAESLLQADSTLGWYPQALATVVIAVDRGQTGAAIHGWTDLLTAGVKVGYSEGPNCIRPCLAAISYGLEGEDFSLDGAAELLSVLQKRGCLSADDRGCPVLICFDYEAAAMSLRGRDMEIVVPREGTLTFELGLLSREEPVFSENSDALLTAAGFRLLNGKTCAGIYPAGAAYSAAVKLDGYGRLNDVCQDSTRTLRRDIKGSRMYCTAEQREHMLAAVLYMILITLWIGSIIGRAMNRNIRRTAMLTGLILIGWTSVRFIKYQIVAAGIVSRYCWYGYYLFSFSIPLLMLFLSWAMDKPDEKLLLPRWLRLCILINSALFLLVMTNDFHSLVFKLDLSTDTWSNIYSYGIGFYFIYACLVVQILSSIAMLIYKSWKSPHRGAVVFPIGLCLFLFLYTLSYALRIPWAFEMDLTMTIGFITLLFFESAMRTGMVPVNTRYAELFKRSTLQMQIVDHGGNVLYRASGVPEISPETFGALSAGECLLRQDENTLIFSDRITGGLAVWQEDISDLNRLLRELEDSAVRLRAANAILGKESEIRRRMLRAEERSRLFTRLEEEIAEKTSLLSRMILELPEREDHRRAAAEITLLLCYIKRRCNFFFIEREQDAVPANDLMTWIDELAEYAKFTGLPVMTRCTVRAEMPTRQTTLFYDFLYAILSWECKHEDGNLLEQLGAESGRFVMKLMFPASPEWPPLGGELLSAVEHASGVIRRQDLGDTRCILLSFPEGGGKNA